MMPSRLDWQMMPYLVVLTHVTWAACMGCRQHSALAQLRCICVSCLHSIGKAAIQLCSDGLLVLAQPLQVQRFHPHIPIQNQLLQSSAKDQVHAATEKGGTASFMIASCPHHASVHCNERQNCNIKNCENACFTLLKPCLSVHSDSENKMLQPL